MHVLIIEDEPIIADQMEYFLTEIGVDSCDVADSEADAISAAQRRTPDLITADYRLRQGNGFDAVTSIRETLGQVPVVFITGNPDKCAVSDDRTRVLSKPVRWAELADFVERHGASPTAGA